MAKLTTQQKEFIIKQLACFERPTDVQSAVKEQFGVDTTLAQVCYYNPESENGRAGLAKRWKELFYETRKRYSTDTSSIAVAQKAHRIRVLQEGVEEAREDGDWTLVSQLLKQIAQEVGGQFTNRHLLELSGEITTTNEIKWEELSDDQLEALAAGASPSEVVNYE